MPENIGSSNRITREYLDSLLIETRYLDSVSPDLTYELWGERFASPIMTAALSHLDHFMFPGAEKALTAGAVEANAALWYGMCEESQIEAMVASGARVIEIIKPYADRDVILRKIAHAEKCGLLAVGVDIDHSFSGDGSNGVVNGDPMAPLTTAELASLCCATKLPFIVKGVLSMRDAEHALSAGARGMVISHHNGAIDYAMPALAMLPEIARFTSGRAKIFVDGEIRGGMDAFKALCLGASGVCVGRPLMTAIKNDQEHGVAEWFRKANAELGKAMAFTGCRDCGHMDAGIIHRI